MIPDHASIFWQDANMELRWGPEATVTTHIPRVGESVFIDGYRTVVDVAYHYPQPGSLDHQRGIRAPKVYVTLGPADGVAE